VAPRKPRTAPKLPEVRRIRSIRDALRGYYGVPRNVPHHAPLDELVLTVLSQNTNDTNRDVAYTRLRERFPDWDAVERAPVEAVEEAIRPGGISKVKSRRIKSMLSVIRERTGGLDLSILEAAPREEAIELLESLPGVGRKTTACVLLFSYDRPELPVDTHVYRVSSRLELIRAKAPFLEAHEVMRAVVPRDETYELHVNLIRHGRRLCTARAPACAECPLRRLCPYGKALLRRRK
jgi:endonuclease-3